MSARGERPRVFGTGLIALDLVVSTDAAAPVRSWAGGTCGNVLSILAYLGWDAYPIARMNGDAASQRVKRDMKRWGVRLDFAACKPTSDTPIIVQEIRHKSDGTPTHKFSWTCPHCGQWLPAYKPVTREAIETISPHLEGSEVFFMDRLSSASLSLATEASNRGGIVFFEPSGKAEPRLMSQALRVAHIVKYADDRLNQVSGAMNSGTATLLEVQTLGDKGLRFRHKLVGKASTWKDLPAIKPPRLADTCGSGDWCTAGLIARLGRAGFAGLKQSTDKDVESALRYGQAMAAWNCGFEGARGGMYSVDRAAFDAQIRAIEAGRADSVTIAPLRMLSNRSIICPACPTSNLRKSKQQRTSRARKASKR